MGYLYNWFVVQGVNEGVPYFWATPIGAGSVLIILLTSIYTLFKQHHDIVDSIYYCALVVICSIALMHVQENSNPRHQMMVIVIALAIKGAWDTYKHIRGNNGQ